MATGRKAQVPSSRVEDDSDDLTDIDMYDDDLYLDDADVEDVEDDDSENWESLSKRHLAFSARRRIEIAREDKMLMSELSDFDDFGGFENSDEHHNSGLSY